MPTPAKTSKPPNHVGANIRAAREAMGITQLELGHALGYRGASASPQISRYESGQHEPQLPTLRRIAAALNTTPENLLREEN